MTGSHFFAFFVDVIQNSLRISTKITHNTFIFSSKSEKLVCVKFINDCLFLYSIKEPSACNRDVCIKGNFCQIDGFLNPRIGVPVGWMTFCIQGK